MNDKKKTNTCAQRKRKAQSLTSNKEMSHGYGTSLVKYRIIRRNKTQKNVHAEMQNMSHFLLCMYLIHDFPSPFPLSATETHVFLLFLEVAHSTNTPSPLDGHHNRHISFCCTIL
ncbi:hypothetical protein, unlikely [Trypanosoma brucei gambiense DAL972]|uniref:Uncharacterized protein n=1 Tax=Trypanosoma brucei gambiense (strain MHOM/CI/86/DAL972) TaxID=679716 RepID=C9ZLM7_TRYB9|nr:hypothetical protein, unlikely [Trypanosoma brucei gambiense DAL972]CBH10302.1 hypothetical protein, unlikely [Trypanosoma brucei gambiense DAL972]|eukprot:XP_011772592.1 hypothetical protein, unlikely [Trypanosoma brucei gambiense DAL972]